MNFRGFLHGDGEEREVNEGLVTMAGMNRLRIAMGQMRVEQGRAGENMARAVEMVARAAGEKAQVVVLPECLDLGWLASGVREEAQEIPGARFDLLARAARQHRIHVVAGLTERAGERVYNSAVLISDEGELLLKHRKINELRFGAKWDVYATGDRLGVAETKLGRVGMSICADNWPGVLCFGHSLGRMGAQLLVSPCAWAVPADFDNKKTPYGGEWEKAYRELSGTYGMGVVAVSNVGAMTEGPWAGWRCIGNSIAFAPGGEKLAGAGHGEEAEEMPVVEMELGEVQDWGARISG